MRHGRPTLAGRLLGHTDCPATEAGVSACADAAARLELRCILSSGLLRADECAAPIACARALPLRRDPRWRELDFGRWDGLAPADIEADTLSRFWANPNLCPPPGGESWTALVARVGTALGEAEDATLIVTHAGAMRAALAVACGFDARQAWAFDLPYASVLSLRLWRGEPAATQIVELRP